MDDDESIRRGLGSVFSHKYEVLTSECGRDAVEALTDAVHCVILDVKMKEQNGFTTYPKLKAKSPNVPIIFYTAFQSEHDLQNVINKFKPEGYVDKGSDITFLDNLVGNAINKYQLILENEGYKKELEKRVEARTEDLRNAMQELKETQVRLIQKEKMASTGRLVSSLSHKLKNPTVAIERTYVNLSKDFEALINQYLPMISSSNLTPINRDSLIRICISLFSTSQKKRVPTTIESIKKAKEIEEVLKENGFEQALDLAHNLAKYSLSKNQLGDVTRLLKHLGSNETLSLLTTVFNIGNQLRNTELSAKEISANINRVLNTARRERERPTEDIAINHIIESAMDLLSHRLEDISVKVYFGDLSRTVGYPVDLMHAFVAVIENSIEALGHLGEIEITTVLQEDNIIVKIIDNGEQGIPGDVRDKMFEPFFTTKRKGTGLGLYQAHKTIVKNHNGTILFESCPGTTKCSVSIPVRGSISEMEES